MKVNRTFRFANVVQPYHHRDDQQSAVQRQEAKQFAVADDDDAIGTDEDALRWAAEHDPETLALLKAGEIE